MSAVSSENPICKPKNFCVMLLKLRINCILSPIPLQIASVYFLHIITYLLLFVKIVEMKNVPLTTTFLIIFTKPIDKTDITVYNKYTQNRQR